MFILPKKDLIYFNCLPVGLLTIALGRTNRNDKKPQQPHKTTPHRQQPAAVPGGSSARHVVSPSPLSPGWFGNTFGTCHAPRGLLLLPLASPEAGCCWRCSVCCTHTRPYCTCTWAALYGYNVHTMFNPPFYPVCWPGGQTLPVFP